ncbi:MAG: hypothetical protein Q8M22_20060 [Actinomycetota bacterium]|nr:hypothetical protein [Actinomycetota bacterium]
MTNNNNEHDPDARIDEMARAAGGALRRPAPADGIARAERSKRTRQTTRLALAGTAVLALGVVGVVAFGGDDANRVGPSDSTLPTTVPDSTSDTTVPGQPSTTGASSTSVAPINSGDPERLYWTTGFIASPGYQQTVIDPTTGEVLRTEAPDSALSMSAQQALTERFVYDGFDPSPPGIGYRFESGDVAYSYFVRGSDSPDLANEDPALLAGYDRCEQSELTVEGADRGALPARVQRMAMSLDRRWLAVVSTECPVDGTLVGQTQIVESTSTVKVFDAANTDRAGLELMSTSNRIWFSSLFFSPDGNYLVVDSGGYRLFDLADGSEMQIAPDGCEVFGGRYARAAGPWVGDSSLLLSVRCPDTASLTVIDVATDETLVVPAPGLLEDAALTVEVDVDHFDRPQNAWFTMCAWSSTRSTCWYGQGSSQPVEIPGAQEASFLPLGFTEGG